MKKTGKNQSLARTINQRYIVNSLRNSSKSCTELALEFGLSFTAVSRIVNELISLEVISPDSDKSSGRELGRKPVVYSVTSGKFLSGIIDFALGQVAVFDFDGTMLFSCDINCHDELVGVIKVACETIKKFVDNCGATLKSIGVIAVGLYDNKSGEMIFSTRYQGGQGVNIVKEVNNFFSDIQVEIINDTRLYMLAERCVGTIGQNQNAILLQIDDGVSLAMQIGGNTFEGDNGFAGEIGISSFEGGSLEEVLSVNSLGAKFDNSLDLFIERYNSGNEESTEIGLNYIENLAKFTRNLNCFFDCEIFICGKIVELGEKFLTLLSDEILEKSLAKKRVIISSLTKNEASIIGGKKFCIDIGFESLLRKIL